MRTLGLSGRAKAMEFLGKKGRGTVSCIKMKCCNNSIECGNLWILQDFKGFTKRKLFIGKCKICGDEVCLQIMTNIESGITYHNLYTGIEAVKTIYREKKRISAALPNIKSDSLFGWVYGHNVEIRNKNKQVTQVRHYAADFSGNKKLTKKVYL